LNATWPTTKEINFFTQWKTHSFELKVVVTFKYKKGEHLFDKVSFQLIKSQQEVSTKSSNHQRFDYFWEKIIAFH